MRRLALRLEALSSQVQRLAQEREAQEREAQEREALLPASQDLSAQDLRALLQRCGPVLLDTHSQSC